MEQFLVESEACKKYVKAGNLRKWQGDASKIIWLDALVKFLSTIALSHDP